MNFYWSPGYCYQYTNVEVLKRKSKKYILDRIKKDITELEKYPTITVNTKVSWRYWFPILDCDSFNHMLVAKHWLKTQGYNTVEIESSPGKYWIIVDKIMPKKKAIEIVTRTPGVDKAYAHYIGHYKVGNIIIRALPKCGSGSIPNFKRCDNIMDPLIKEWVEDFENWWLYDVKPLMKMLRLASCLKDGTIKQVIADPKFVI